MSPKKAAPSQKKKQKTAAAADVEALAGGAAADGMPGAEGVSGAGSATGDAVTQLAEIARLEAALTHLEDAERDAERGPISEELGRAMAELQAELDEARAKEAAAEAGGVPGAGLAAGDDVPEAGDEPEAEGVSGAGARAQVTLRKAERPEQKPMLIVAPELKRDTPLCHRCRKPVEVFKSQLLATKSQGSWRCNLCNSKGTQLSRVFGAWPPSVFQTLVARSTGIILGGRQAVQRCIQA